MDPSRSASFLFSTPFFTEYVVLASSMAGERAAALCDVAAVDHTRTAGPADVQFDFRAYAVVTAAPLLLLLLLLLLPPPCSWTPASPAPLRRHHVGDTGNAPTAEFNKTCRKCAAAGGRATVAGGIVTSDLLAPGWTVKLLVTSEAAAIGEGADDDEQVCQDAKRTRPWPPPPICPRAPLRL